MQIGRSRIALGSIRGTRKKIREPRPDGSRTCPRIPNSSSVTAAAELHSDAQRPASAAIAASVNADGLQLVAPCIRDRSFAAIGEHDRGAVGGMQREQL